MGEGVEACELLVDRLGGNEWVDALTEFLQVGDTNLNPKFFNRQAPRRPEGRLIQGKATEISDRHPRGVPVFS